MRKMWMSLACMVLCVACSAPTPASADIADVTGENWQERRFGKELVRADGTKVPVAELKGKVIGVYFSAHWCPPCRKFTPELVKFRNQVAKDGFEVVFVSADQTKDKMFEYMTETKMSWLAVDFKGEKANALFKDMGVRGIPYLVILGKDGKVITTDGRSDVMGKGTKALKAWKK